MTAETTSTAARTPSDFEHQLPEFTPLHWSLAEIRAAIPTRFFARDTTRSVYYLARDIAMASILWWMATFIDTLIIQDQVAFLTTPHTVFALRSVCWAIYWWFQGLVFTGIWVMGHEASLLASHCGHGAFSSNRTVCDAIGFVIHSALWTPYFSWKISHHRHHISHGSMERDEVYVPKVRSDLGISVPPQGSGKLDYDELLGDTPIYTLFTLVRQQLLAFPAYLLFNVSGQKNYPRWTNHFDPNSILFAKGQRNIVILSNAGISFMIFTVYQACKVYGAGAVIRYYGIPWLLVSHWFICITYLHHTDPELPHYRKTAWNYQRGAAATVDRPVLGWQGRFFLHDVAHFHVIHHFFPKMPWYHGEEATQYLKDFLGEHYAFSDQPVFKALWRNYNDCQFVDDEGDILFYRDKRGQTRRRPAGEAR
ncbi:fatty acid desaturase-domain-containing protein [Amylostereum chailletii]|nr:fatty acid desaturase-domain-containing protein [Amylostereum chailletii]